MTKLVWIAIGSVVVTGTIIGGGFYYIQNKKHVTTEEQLTAQVSSLQSQIIDLKQDLEDQKEGQRKQEGLITPQKFTDTSCEFWQKINYGKIRLAPGNEEVAGSLDIGGKIISREKKSAWDQNKDITVIYFAIPKPTYGDGLILFYNQYAELVKQGNAINTLESDTLLFRLGIKENGTLKTEASITDEWRQSVIDNADSGKPSLLNLTIAPPPGRGASDFASYACNIRAGIYN